MNPPYSKSRTREELDHPTPAYDDPPEPDEMEPPVRHLGYIPLVPVSGSERRLEVFERSDGVISFRRQLNTQPSPAEKFAMTPEDMPAFVIDLAATVHVCGRHCLKLIVASVGPDQWSALILQAGGMVLNTVVRHRATQAIEDLASELLELARKKESQLAQQADDLRRLRGDR